MKQSKIYSLLAGLLLMALWGCEVIDPTPDPVADFTYQTSNNGVSPSEVTFTNTSKAHDDSNLKDAEWDFGDGSPKERTTNYQVKHTYTRGDEFTVTLTVTDQNGQKNSKKEKITIEKRPTTVVITKITLHNLPFEKSNGELWDYVQGSEAPDVYLRITDESLTEYLQTSSYRWENLGKAQLPVSYSPRSNEIDRLRITNLTSTYFLEVWDGDGWFRDPAEEMGHIRFTIEEKRTSSNRFPSQITLEGNGIKATLELRWDTEEKVSGK